MCVSTDPVMAEQVSAYVLSNLMSNLTFFFQILKLLSCSLKEIWLKDSSLALVYVSVSMIVQQHRVAWWWHMAELYYREFMLLSEITFQCH